MRTLLLSLVVLITALQAQAQTVSSFENLPLAGTDTFYVNYNTPGFDVGFQDGYAYFPCMYDTGFGYAYWSYGFAYSNMHDSSTSGFGNQYAAKAYKGYNGSDKYAVAYGSANYLNILPYAAGKRVKGFYITNSTYAYNSMRDGDAFSKKFGGATGNDPDWFKLTIRGYLGNVRKNDSVDFYLADYRSSNNASDYIVKDWRWVNLESLGGVDSLSFELTSSDGGQFGMNTPAYFCMDNFTTSETSQSVGNTAASIAKVYPNPASDRLFVENTGNTLQQISLMDMSGKLLAQYTVASRVTEINTAVLPAGTYLLQLRGEQTAMVKFQKQ